MPEAGRVITGLAKGTRLLAPGAGTRPLADRVKQALFSALEAELAGRWPVTFLDLFAGSGAAGIEALSRGAPGAVFVERDPATARVLARNLERAGMAGGRIVRGDAGAVLRKGRPMADAPFGAVLVDPPYGQPAALTISLELLGDGSLAWLEPWAIVATKHFWRDAGAQRAGSLALLRQRRFGETVLSYYRAPSFEEAH